MLATPLFYDLALVTSLSDTINAWLCVYVCQKKKSQGWQIFICCCDFVNKFCIKLQKKGKGGKGENQQKYTHGEGMYWRT